MKSMYLLVKYNIKVAVNGISVVSRRVKTMWKEAPY